LVLDTYGELGAAYAVADVVVVGGGFGEYGGQNLIQPLALGKPVLHGPHMFNFAQASKEAVDSGASRVCDSSESLTAALEEILGDENLRASMGEAAKGLVEKHRGASEKYADAILQALR
jgi:3-deoxy-D-manno-octulosonic-acid transferase